MAKARSSTRWISGVSVTLAALVTVAAVPPRHSAPTQPPVPPGLFAGLVWRNVGPFRGGRVAAVTGAMGEPGVFYAGLPLGGVWKTTSAGQTWFPVFDSVKEASSVGSIEVAPSDPNVIYVGMGDMITGGGINEGNGVYKSTDAGNTWQHLGLDATKQIPSILVDPRDPNLVMIAAQGNIHAKTDMRGVFRSVDGGKTWTKTLYVDDETGIQKLARAFDRPSVILATTVRHYVAPGIPLASTPSATPGLTGTALYKSTDEGLTWKNISGAKGLPRLAGRTSVAVAMNTNAQRMYLIQNSGLYRSDDGGDSWRQMDAADHRIANGQGGYNCGVYVDPQNSDIVYTISTSSYKSTDGGNTFTGFKGAPGGDDPQQLWIDPHDGKRMFFGVDQGATISLDGGATWSSWYNQSTEQVYHISTDNSFPYWIYATQQDAGAIRTRSRGNLGEITPLDWSPVPGWEWGTIVADPLNPNLVYASGSGIVKIFYPSEQWINVSPAADPNTESRTTSSQPILFSPINQHELLAGLQFLASTTDGGVSWKKLSPDLTYPKGQTPPAPAPATSGAARTPPNRNAIESISASSVSAGTIWVGTNNGLIHVTRDHGATWQDVSIPNLPNAARGDISAIDASHQDAATAYVAIDFHTIGDYKPYFFRTRDYGRTWTQIVNGMQTDQSSGSFARVIRADPKKPGLLYAGTESSVYVSFDDGDNWQSLMLNLPNTSYRDITFHGNDLVIGTYGRGIWVLDDYAVLHQVTPSIAREAVHLFKPDETIRVRRNVNADTPFPPEAPHALNPPDGVVIYYSLASAPRSPITLDVIDAAGDVVRHMTSVLAAPVKEAAEPPEPNFWIAPPISLPTNVGINRATWDFRYDAPPAFTHTFEINANPGLTPASPEGPMAMPGAYTIRLNVDGRSYAQSVTIRNDPRSSATLADMKSQTALLLNIYAGARESWDGYNQVAAMRSAVVSLTGADHPADVVAAARAFDAKLDSVGGSTTPSGGGFRRGGPPPPPDFVRINGTMGRALAALDNADMAPNSATLRGYAADCMQLRTVVTSWQTVNTKDLPTLNAVLAKNNVTQIRPAAPALALPSCGEGLSPRDRRTLATRKGTTVSHSKADEDEGDEGAEPL